MSPTATKMPLLALLEELGYGEELRREEIRPPGASIVLDFVGFTRAAPQDIRTSAITAVVHRDLDESMLLAGARQMATPFALIASGDTIRMFRVTADPQYDEVLTSFDIAAADRWDVSAFRRELDPVALQIAKSGLRQLTLFPIDARLLAMARDQSVGSLRTRLEAAFAQVLETRKYNETEAARLVISALAAVIVRDKYGRSAVTASTIVASALQRHRSYFSDLAHWEMSDADVVSSVLAELSQDVDYSAIDARSVNSIYEHLFMTPELRKQLGTFYTDPLFASRILEHLPVEEIPPDSRCVVDPACGSGNFLLAAQERLEALAPTSWSPEVTHDWLKTHVVGADVDPIATEIAKLSLLVSALPLGNTWRVESRDFLNDPPVIEPPPTILVTNPPWHNPKGKQRETASAFLRGAVNLLEDGGLLACIMPVTWLSGRQHRVSRDELRERCDLFEVWRLPRDMFPDARVGSAVVFARKNRQPTREWAAFRWVKAGFEERRDFINEGRSTFSAIIPASAGASPTWGPMDDFFRARPFSQTLSDVATVSSGVVQRGLPTSGRPSGKRIPALLRGASPSIYRSLDSAYVTWVDDITSFVTNAAQAASLQVAPKILVQADRFPDNAWRVRPVMDEIGVMPVGVWHAIVCDDDATTYALHALLATSPVSCWVHSHATGKRIPVDLVKALPLPATWDENVGDLAAMGRSLSEEGGAGETLERAEELVAAAYGLRKKDRAAIGRVMAGYQAPEGLIRVSSDGVRNGGRRDSTARVSHRAGTVVDIEKGRVRLWLVGMGDDGELVDLPAHMPGWLCAKGQTFDLEGDVADGHYHFHRTAFMSEEAIWGVEHDGDPHS